MKKTLLVALLLASAVGAVAQNHAAVNVKAKPSPLAIDLSWEQDDYELETLSSVNELVTKYGVGYAGADVSEVQNSIGLLGLEIAPIQNSGCKLSDDFFLIEYSYISEIEFYVRQTNYFNQDISTIMSVLVEIYDNSPKNGGQPIFWKESNQFRINEFAGIYRVSEGNFSNRYNPIFKVTADVGVDLDWGQYWVVISYLTSEACYVPARTGWGEAVTGDALYYYENQWSEWLDNGHPQGMPFALNGIQLHQGVKPIGFNVYRDGVKANDVLLTVPTFRDELSQPNETHSYTVETVYSDNTYYMSESAAFSTIEAKPVENVDIAIDVNKAVITWSRPDVDAEAVVSYDVSLNGTCEKNVVETGCEWNYLQQGTYNFCVNAVYADGTRSETVRRDFTIGNCFAPIDLTAKVDENNVELEWRELAETYEMHSFSKEPTHYMASTNFIAEWAIAHRYLPEDIEEQGLAGMALTKVAFYPGSSSNVYSLQVYYDNGWGSPDEMVYNQQIPKMLEYERNEVLLTEPVIVNPDKALWVVLNCCQTVVGAVFGMDEGPAVNLKGNWVFLFDGWELVENNVCIESFFGGDASLRPDKENNSTYNIYRDGSVVASGVSECSYTDFNVPDGIYMYGVQRVKDDVTSAVREIEVKVGNVSLDENEEMPSSVCPNPGGDEMHVCTTIQHAEVVVYDIGGRLVARRPLTSTEVVIDASQWAKGMYLWKIVSEGMIIESGKWGRR